MVRDLYLGDIDEENVEKIMKKIIEINEKDRKENENLKTPKSNPIKLYINSSGGYVYEGFGLVDLIKNSTTPIHTIGMGHVMSMALPIFLAGSKRFAGENCTFMYHQVQSGTFGGIREMREDLHQSERLQEMIDDFIINNCKMPIDKMDEYKDKKKDWYFRIKEATEMGIVHFQYGKENEYGKLHE